MGATGRAHREDTDRDPRIAARPSGAAPQFHETWDQYLRRIVLGAAYALRPRRIALLPRLWLMTLTYYLKPKSERDTLPAHPTFYSDRGLVGISNDLSVPALLKRYSHGLFPVCHIGPMKWWCPKKRAVMNPESVHVSKHVRRALRQGTFTVTMDQAFGRVMEACARPRAGKVPLTWITPQIMRAFWQAHKRGYAHSVEVWDKDGNLVGGMYGLTIGQVYFGESQFSRVRDASKVAGAVLNRHLVAWGYRLCDAKWLTPHLESLGFVTMERDDFLSLLQWYVESPGHPRRWAVDPSLDVADWSHDTSTSAAAPVKVA